MNLPPACSINSIPGNRPEDVEFEGLLEDISAFLNKKIVWWKSLKDEEQERIIDLFAEAISERDHKIFNHGYEMGFQEGIFEQKCKEDETLIQEQWDNRLERE